MLSGLTTRGARQFLHHKSQRDCELINEEFATGFNQTDKLHWHTYHRREHYGERWTCVLNENYPSRIDTEGQCDRTNHVTPTGIETLAIWTPQLAIGILTIARYIFLWQTFLFSSDPVLELLYKLESLLMFRPKCLKVWFIISQWERSISR